MEPFIAAAAAGVLDNTIGKQTFDPIYNNLRSFDESLPAMINGSMYASAATLGTQYLINREVDLYTLIPVVGATVAIHYLGGRSVYNDITSAFPGSGRFLGSLYTALGTFAGIYLATKE